MKPAPVLITGATGLLGKYLFEAAPPGVQLSGTFHRLTPPPELKSCCFPLDLSSDETVISRLLDQLRPEWVLHTAGVGAVDEAEKNPGPVRRVNVDGTRAIAGWCRRNGAALIAISSNAVFNGENPPYAEDSPRDPINEYGRIKLEAEDAVRASGCRHLIVRPILLYGWPWPGGRQNVVTRWLQAMESAQPVQVDREIHSMPLYARDCAEAIWAAAERETSGTLHLAGPEKIALVEFARAVARQFGHSENLVEPIAASQVNVLAPRPKDTSFITRRLSEELALRPRDVLHGLADMQEQRARVSPVAVRG